MPPKCSIHETARNLNQQTYFTGKPCIRGHICDRYVISRNCVMCQKMLSKESGSAYYEDNKETILIRNKEWRDDNKEHNIQIAKEYYIKNTERCLQQSKKWKDDNKEHVSMWCREYYLKNKEKNKEKNKARRQKKYWEGGGRELNKNFRENNSEYYNAKGAQRRAHKLKATVSWSNQKYIKLWYKLATIEQERTERVVHVDHIVPLVSDYVCGLHCEDNMQLLFKEENLKKSNMVWPDMWDIDKELISLKNQYKKIPQ